MYGTNEGDDAYSESPTVDIWNPWGISDRPHVSVYPDVADSAYLN